MTNIRFNIAQTFMVDSTATGNVSLTMTSVDLFFMYKPPATNNRSGIIRPGITMYLANTIFNVPQINANTFTNFARVEWDGIQTSSDATVATTFRFNEPVSVLPHQLYAMVLAFDGNETFWPWVAKVGSWVVGTRNVYSGPSGNFTGQYFEFTTTDTNNDVTTAQNMLQYQSYWRPLNDTTLKFKASVARYFMFGTPIKDAAGDLLPAVIVFSNNVIQQSNGTGQLDFDYPSIPTEQVTFSLANSQVMSFVGAQRVFQNTVFYPGGYQNGSGSVTVSTVSGANSNSAYLITANTSLPNGQSFNWNTVFGNYTGVRYITVFDTTKVNVRLVRSIISNTVLQVTEPLTFTNTGAKFLISPIATVDSLDTNSPSGKKTEFMRMIHSNANATHRFVNNCIEVITPAAGSTGSGYNNNNIMYVQGFQNVAGKVIGGYPAVANIVTNPSGNITAVYLSNIGCGFVNASSIIAVMANSTSGNNSANTSAGSGAVFTYTVGATLRTELTPNIFRNCTFVNLDVNDCTPFFDVSSPPGTTFELDLRVQYYMINDATTYDGYAYYLYPDVGGQWFNNIQLLQRNRFIADKVPVFMSYSNEFTTLYSNGAQNDQVNALTLTCNNFVLRMHTTSNNDYIVVSACSVPTIEFGKYIINNDYTKEHTNFGNCWAKHLTTMANFERTSEDIRVYMDVYKPANTDFQVYARIQQAADVEAFDDEDWTRLQLIDGINVMSSLSDEKSYIELTYGFQPHPNVDFTFSSLVTTVNNSANIVGNTNTWAANLAVNDLVKIYDPLFPNTNYMVASVKTVDGANVVIDQPVLSTINPALTAPNYPLKVDRLAFPYQGFNNIQSDNVVRYYNTSIVKWDGYNTLQLKVCLLSSHLTHYPKIRDIRVVSTSA